MYVCYCHYHYHRQRGQLPSAATFASLFFFLLCHRVTPVLAAADAEADSCNAVPGGCSKSSSFEGLPLRAIDIRENLSYANFVTEYKEKGLPVIIRRYLPLLESRQAFLDALGDERCASTHLNFYDARLKGFLAQLSPEGWDTFEDTVEKMSGASLDDSIARLRQGLTLDEFQEYLVEQSEFRINLDVKYDDIASYMLPLNVQDTKLEDVCRPALTQVLVPKYAQTAVGERVLLGQDGNPANEHGCAGLSVLEPNLFMAAANSRAYPAHAHKGFHGNLLLVMSGSKRLVHWPVEERHRLYRFNKTLAQGSSPELLFAAEGLRPSALSDGLGSQPDVADAVGYTGIAEEGDMIYVPCGGVHAVENLGPGPTIAVRYVLQDEAALTCRRRVHALVRASGDETERKYWNVPSSPESEAELTANLRVWTGTRFVEADEAAYPAKAQPSDDVLLSDLLVRLCKQ